MAKILLVEDNAMNRDMLSRRLIGAGYERRDRRRTAGRASRRRSASLPDLILMDMSLPEIDGWEATRQLKADAGDAAHPGHRADRSRDVERPRQRALEAGCDDYDTKPVEFDAAARRRSDACSARAVRVRPDRARCSSSTTTR